jgi:hypothetical protein
MAKALPLPPEVKVAVDTLPAVADVDKAPLDVSNWKFFSQFIKRQFMANAPTPASNYFLSTFGGAVRNEPPCGSAFPDRDALFSCEPGAGWNGREPTSTGLPWVTDFARASRPNVDGTYVDVPNVGASEWETQYCGSNVDRLRQVKATHDPFNVFSFEQSVPPKAT